MLKKTLIGVFMLLVVLVVATVAVVALVDVNRFKPQIEQFVQDSYQRTLRIDGDLGLSLFPRLALSLPRSSLSEAGGTGEAASLEGAKVSVAVMPLLRGEVVADKVTVNGLKATVERREDGSLSIDDLIGKSSAEPAAPADPAEPGGALPQLDIGGIELTDAQVVFRDLQADNTMTISGLDLKTGRIANKGETPISLDFAFAATNPEAKGELKLEGDARRASTSVVETPKAVPTGPPRYYVAVGKPASRVPELSSAALDEAHRALVDRLGQIDGVVIAPSNESNAAARSVLRKRSLKGFYIESAVTSVAPKSGGTKVAVSVIVATYPDRAMRAIMQGSATAIGGGDTRVQALVGAFKSALNQLPQALARE